MAAMRQVAQMAAYSCAPGRCWAWRVLVLAGAKVAEPQPEQGLPSAILTKTASLRGVARLAQVRDGWEAWAVLSASLASRRLSETALQESPGGAAGLQESAARGNLFHCRRLLDDLSHRVCPAGASRYPDWAYVRQDQPH